MYTIDTFIERLKSLREIADKGGETPVTISGEIPVYRQGVDYDSFESAAAELQNVVPAGDVDHLWFVKETPQEEDDTEQVLNIF